MRKVIEGVTIEMTPNKKYNFDYNHGDMKAVYNRGQWRNWQEEIAWLEKSGEADNELTPGETIALVEDLRSLQKTKAPFAEEPMKAYRAAHKYRNENNKRFGDEHNQLVEMARQSGRSKSRKSGK